MEQCGAATRGGGTCKNKAGYKTDHPGQGRCHLHGGKTPVKHGRYSKINRPRLKELIAEFESDDDPLNLLPELSLLRALILDFVERYDEQTDALIAWHASFSPGFSMAFQTWQGELDQWRKEWAAWQEAWGKYREEAEQVQGYYRQGWPEPPVMPAIDEPPPAPDPADFQTKPRQVTDILRVGDFIAQIGTITDRVQKQQQEGTITLAQLNQVLQQFGFEMYQGLSETVPDESLRSAILEVVEGRWSKLTLPTGDKSSR